ncbi:MAG: DEAD/DEAH box helicase [Eubacterium sp.]|nr:DEAD/DEAH box helicase [Eubacterium sp.]
MKSWRSLFTQNILSRGKAYYNAGKAKKLSDSEDPHDPYIDLYDATVRGSRNYHVQIRATGQYIKDMSCTCPYAEQGNACKHEAAVLLAIENEYGKLYVNEESNAKSDHDSTASSQIHDDAASGSNRSGSARPDTRTQQTPVETADVYDIMDQDGNIIAHGKKSSLAGERVVDIRDVMQKFQNLQEENKRDREANADQEQTATYKPDHYHYFHPEKFRQHLNISSALLYQAEEIAYPERQSGTTGSRTRGWGPRQNRKSTPDTRITEFNVSTGYLQHSDNSSSMSPMVGQASARFEGSDGPFRVTLLFDQNKILTSQCMNWDCRYSEGYPTENPRKLCAHELAVLILLEDYLHKHELGDASSYEAEGFLTGFSTAGTPEMSGKNQDTSLRSAENLTLEPRLELEADSLLSATFYIGAGRLYKIKNLGEFLTQMQHRERTRFGSATMLQLGEDYLKDEESRSWYHFIEDALEDQREYRIYTAQKMYGYSDNNKLDTDVNLPLFGTRLDRFADLIGDRPFELWDKQFSAKDGKKTIRLRDKDMSAVISITPVKDKTYGNINGIHLTSYLPHTINGMEHLYYYDEPWLNRLTTEATRNLKLLNQSAQDNEIDLVIGRKNLARFYHDVLPNLRKIAEVHEKDAAKIQSVIPPEPEFTAYLDYDRKTLICHLEAAYGQEVFSVTDAIYAGLENMTLVPTYRDRSKEEFYSTIAQRYFHNFDPDLKLLYTEKDDDALFELLDHGISELMDYGEVRMTPQFRSLGIRHRLPVKVGVNVESNLLDLSVSSEDLTEDEILFQYRRKKKYIRLKDGSLLKLDQNDSVEELNKMLEILQIPLKEFVKGKLQLPAYRALYLDRMLETSEDLYAVRDRRFKHLVKEFKTVEDADFDVPKSLEGTLRKYQKDGYRWLRVLAQYGFGGILADEMGLGKTLQVITVLLASKEEAEQDNRPVPTSEDAPSRVSLIISPASLIYNWEEELHRFAPALRTKVIAGTALERKAMLKDYADYDVIVTSYDLLKRDIAEYEDLRFHYEVIDEAQYIKNPGTAASKSVKLIHAATRFALTGTPIENRLSELWSIFDYLMPGFLYHYDQFHNTFEQPIAGGDEEAAEQLKRMVSPFILRRLKKDVLKDLPEKLEEVRYVQMGKKQQKLYDAEVLRMKRDLAEKTDEDFRKGKLEILAAITRIRQICCDPSLCYEDYDGESAKREAVLDLIHSLTDSGHRALLFSQFTSMLSLLREDLIREKIPFFEITGATRKEERIRLVREFNENPDIPVFLISLKAGGTGLNLTGADVVIHYDPWWNTSAEDQATDRAHRIGQKRVVTVYKMIIRNSMEDRILEMQKRKKDLADQILSGESLASSTITKDDLMQILS